MLNNRLAGFSIGLTLAFSAVSASAGNFDGYIKLRNESSAISKAAIAIYHQGIAETLFVFTRSEKNKNPNASICPPSGKVFDEAFVGNHAMELWRDAVSKKLEADMKEQLVGVKIAVSLSMKYPCK